MNTFGIVAVFVIAAALAGYIAGFSDGAKAATRVAEFHRTEVIR